MKKNWFLLFLIISLGLTAFLAGYIMVKRGADTSSDSKTGTILDKFDAGQRPVNDVPQPAATENRPVLLTDRRVMSVINSGNKGGIMYFDKNTGKLLELDLETKTEQPVLDKVLPNLTSAIWSPTKKEFIGSFVSGSGKVFKYFDIYSGKEVHLNSNVRSVSFSPDGNLIVYHYLDETSSQSQVGKIIISEPDGKYQKKILDTRLKEVEVGWPIRENMSLKTNTSELFILSEDGKLTNLLESSFGLNIKWSPGGKKLLFSLSSDGPDQADKNSSVLKIKNLESKEEKDLAETSVSKCAWSMDDIHIFCAIPKSPSVDEVFKISTLDGSMKLAAEPLTRMGDLLLSTLEDRLIFTDTSDGKLYSIKISK